MGVLDILKGPKLLSFVRYVQIFFAVAFLVLICIAGTRRAWWNNLNGPLALGVITVIFTLVLGTYTLWEQRRGGSNPFAARGTIYTIARLAFEILVFLMWIGTAALALRPHTGCGPGHRSTLNGKDACFGKAGHTDPHWYYTDQPLTTWDIAIACSLVEVVTFLPTIFLVFKDNKANKVSDRGTTYGA